MHVRGRGRTRLLGSLAGPLHGDGTCLGLAGAWEIARPQEGGGHWRLCKGGGVALKYANGFRQGAITNLVNLDQRQIWKGTRMLGMMTARQDMKLPTPFGDKLGSTAELGSRGGLG